MPATNLGFVSEAYNPGALVTGVNPQTGSFQACITLADLTIGVQAPASFALSLSIGPMTMARLPISWEEQWAFYAALNLPRIDVRNMKIYFADGAVEELIDRGSTYELLYHRVKDIKIEKKYEFGPDESPWFLICRKGGIAEYYNSSGYLEKIASPAGHYIEFSYYLNQCRFIKAKTGAAPDVLSQLEITYDDKEIPSSVIKTINPGSNNKKSEISLIDVDWSCKSRGLFSTCSKDNTEYYVRSVKLPADDDSYKFYYHQRVISSQPLNLTNIETPYGSALFASWAADSIKYGKINSDMQYIPVVQALCCSPISIAYDEKVKSLLLGSYWQEFEYNKDKNFTGYTDTPEYTPHQGKDNCILHTDDYTYTSTETRGCNQNIQVIKKTYNRFHLLIREVTDYRSSSYFRVTKVYTYAHIMTGQDISGQPASFHFWTRCDTTYQEVSNGQELPNRSRIESQLREFDNYGNLTSETDPSGIQTVYEYYPATAEIGCDAAPYGMPCFLKKITIKPNSTTSNNKLAGKEKSYTYTKVSGNSYSYTVAAPPSLPSGSDKTLNYNSFMLLPFTVFDNNVLMETNSYKASGSTFADKLLTGALTNVSNWSNRMDNELIYTWSIDSDKALLTQGKEYTYQGSTGDKKRRSGGTVTLTLATGQPHSETAPNGTITNYAYDEKERLSSVTTFAGPPEVKTVTYQPWSGSTAANVVSVKKNEFETIYSLNNNLQPVKIESNARVYPVIQYYTYNPDGTPCEDMATETFESYDPDTERAVVVTIKYGSVLTEYPTISNTQNASGANLWTATDPVSRTKTQTASGANVFYESTFNEYGKVSSIRQHGYVRGQDGQITALDQTLTTNDYDGFGRLISTTSNGANKECKCNTRYEYDAFDRIIIEEVYLIDTSAPEMLITLFNSTCYGYSNHILSFDSPTSILCECGAPPGGNSTTNQIITSSTCEYDGFGRLISQKTPGGLIPSNISTWYDYINTIDDLPSTVKMGTGTTPASASTSVAYTYYQDTGLLKSMALTNATGDSNIPANTTATYTYDSTTKLLTEASMSQAGSSSPLSKYTYMWTDSERVYWASCKYPALDEFVMTFMYTPQGKPSNTGYFFGGQQPKLRYLYSYDNPAGFCNKVRIALGSTKKYAEAEISINYVLAGNGYAIGNISSITLLIKDFFSDGNLESSCEYTYDDFGRELNRYYKNTGHLGGSMEILQVYDAFSKVTSRTVDIKNGQSFSTSYANTYSYLNEGSGTPLQESRQTKVTRPTTTPEVYAAEEQSKFVYSFSGLSRFNMIKNKDEQSETYSYAYDRVTGYVKNNVLEGFQYDKCGNVMSDNRQGMLRYNALNQLGTYNKNIGGAPNTYEKATYIYNPFNNLCTVNTADGSSIYYLYDGELVIGEVEMKGSQYIAVSWYLRVGDFVLGRFLEVAPMAQGGSWTYYLEWYMTDSFGSVRGVNKFRYQSSSTDVNSVETRFYDYSDYGERMTLQLPAPPNA